MADNHHANIMESFGLNSSSMYVGEHALTDIQIVRSIPSRRCVFCAIWQGEPVFVKMFYGNRANDYALRDMAGIRALQEANIITPMIRYHGEVKEPDVYAVIYEAIIDADNAEAKWQQLNDTEQIRLAIRLVETIAAHHNAKLIQTDMYLKNFLVTDHVIYTIDGDGIKRFDLLSKHQALYNLCRLLSKFDVLMLNQHISTLLKAYSDARLWDAPPNTTAINIQIAHARRKALAAYAKKVFRQCSDVNVTSDGQVFAAVRSQYPSQSIPLTAKQLDDYLTIDKLIKDGNTCTVALASVGKRQLVIKRYNIKNFWHGLSRAFRQTRASISWANAHRLELLGILTASPVALIEERWFGLKRRAYFLTEYVDAPDASAFFKQMSDKAMRAKAVKALVELFYRLYLLQISHGDMKASNIKILTGGEPLLIDLDSMKQHTSAQSAIRMHTKDIKRFMQNWKDEPSLYNAFVKVFKVVYADHAPLLAAQIF
ncbi:MAG: lipopolysaccharide kinase InaA family protein [Methylotenera sp.]|jgi:tRNA A-37 threonylcarbamoyl transferase component Bud32